MKWSPRGVHSPGGVCFVTMKSLRSSAMDSTKSTDPNWKGLFPSRRASKAACIPQHGDYAAAFLIELMPAVQLLAKGTFLQTAVDDLNVRASAAAHSVSPVRDPCRQVQPVHSVSMRAAFTRSARVLRHGTCLLRPQLTARRRGIITVARD